MNKWQNSPFVLRAKIFLTLFTGVGSFILAGIVFMVSRDHILLVLSGIIFVCCLFRSIGVLLLLLSGNYETITGTCTAVLQMPLRRYQKITLTDGTGTETTLLLGKQIKIKPDECYHFYFRKSRHPRLGNDYLDASLSTDLFLGYGVCPSHTQKLTEKKEIAE
ncbi:MAG: hypothetical protein NC331_06525 [Lachnospiraceae bacterium]|nr:hypothetical protein [Lachnospiraceae bacterium]MCM1239026.1 hypothetical protein [Lachnospiraceae bacterium]